MDAPNRAPPAWMPPLLATTPACFSERTWVIYVEAIRVEAIVDRGLAKQLERGRAPMYCDACSVEYRARMQAEGRCVPPLNRVVPATAEAAE